MPLSNDLDPQWSALATEVAHHLAQHLDAGIAHARAASPWYDVRQAAAYIGVTDRALRTMSENGLVPTHRPRPRMIRFHRDDLDNWMRENGEHS